MLVVLTHLRVVALMCAGGTNAAMAHAVARGGNPAAVGPALAFACANITTGTTTLLETLYEVRCCSKDGEKVTMATSTNGSWDASRFSISGIAACGTHHTRSIHANMALWAKFPAAG